MMQSTTILTNFHKDHLKIVISGKSTIIIEHLPEWLTDCEIIIDLHNHKGGSVYKECVKIKLPYEFQLPYLRDGIYTLHIFYKSKTNSNNYIGLNTANGYPLNISLGAIGSIIARTFENNKRIFVELNEKFVQDYNSNIVPTSQFIPDEIVKLAHKITRFSYSNYEKILAIHDWVASNIYYDYDSLADNSYIHQKRDALSVVNRKRTVCAGYSKLAVTLLRAVGVAAVNMDCFALGGSTCGDWEVPSNMEDEANHVVTFAYADDRWLMMDVTWDSDNEYRNGNYGKKSGYGVSHQYFDCTLAFFSYTHRFIKKL